jgi:hypothetical protein
MGASWAPFYKKALVGVAFRLIDHPRLFQNVSIGKHRRKYIDVSSALRHHL